MDRVNLSDFSTLGVSPPPYTRRIPKPSSGSWPKASVVVGVVVVQGVIGGTDMGVNGLKGHQSRGLETSNGGEKAGDETLLRTESLDLPRPTAEVVRSCNDPDRTSCLSVEANPDLLEEVDDDAADKGV